MSFASILHNQKPIPGQNLLTQGPLPNSTDFHENHYARYCEKITQCHIKLKH
jgi:hypothetical protein